MVNTLTDSPVASHTLAFDQPLMESNNKYFAHTLVVDHQIGDATAGLTGGRTDATAKEGYHTIIHYVNQGADPAPIAGVGQLYTKTVGADVALFYESGLGIVQQLTGNITPVAATNGKSFLAGGLIIQWGSATSADGTVVAFNTPFPTNLYSLVISHSAPGAGENTGAIISAASKTLTGFTLRVSGSGSASYSYVAIGN